MGEITTRPICMFSGKLIMAGKDTLVLTFNKEIRKQYDFGKHDRVTVAVVQHEKNTHLSKRRETIPQNFPEEDIKGTQPSSSGFQIN